MIFKPGNILHFVDYYDEHYLVLVLCVDPGASFDHKCLVLNSFGNDIDQISEFRFREGKEKVKVLQ